MSRWSSSIAVHEELAPSALIAERAAAATRWIRRLAALAITCAVVGSGLDDLEFGRRVTDGAGLAEIDIATDGYSVGRFLGGTTWVLVIAGLAVALSHLLRATAAALLVDITRAEIEVGPTYDKGR